MPLLIEQLREQALLHVYMPIAWVFRALELPAGLKIFTVYAPLRATR